MCCTMNGVGAYIADHRCRCIASLTPLFDDERNTTSLSHTHDHPYPHETKWLRRIINYTTRNGNHARCVALRCTASSRGVARRPHGRHLIHRPRERTQSLLLHFGDRTRDDQRMQRLAEVDQRRASRHRTKAAVHDVLTAVTQTRHPDHERVGAERCYRTQQRIKSMKDMHRRIVISADDGLARTTGGVRCDLTVE